MARVVVVGGGFGGTATAARLAKLGHDVTLVEQCRTLGGALRPVEQDGYRWDAAAAYTLLPAVVRDLFRKSGRPAEQELELVARPVVREHRFADGTRVALPGGSRAAQLRSLDALGGGLGQQWCDYVASYTEDWELIRRHYLERPWAPELAPREVSKRLLTRETLDRRIRHGLRDERLRLIAAFPAEYAGHRLQDVPGWVGVEAYVEQTFGAWTVPGGMSGLAAALDRRLATRKVAVLAGTTVRDLVLRGREVVAVDTDVGRLDADAVVVAVDPRRLPSLAPYAARTMPVDPPAVCYLGLRGDLPAMAPETVLHAPRRGPTLVVRTGGTAPEGHHAWTVHGRVRAAEDLVATLASYGLDVRPHVVVRVDRSPAEQVRAWGGSPYGLRWQGRRTVTDRLGPRTPLAGVYAAGAHATPGGGLPFVGLSAALVAQAIGPAAVRPARRSP